jgi:hypothetical protein
MSKGKLVFLPADLGHDDVLKKRKTFALFLKTSGLAEVRSSGAVVKPSR